MNKLYPVEKKTRQEILDFADKDSVADYKEFIREIYLEAYNWQQNDDEKIAKLLAKCSALFVRLSKDQERVAERNLLTAKIILGIAFTTLLVAIIQLIKGC